MILIIREILALIAFSSAVVFGIGGLIGLFRFPDPYSRLQAGSLCGTTAVFSIFIGALLLATDTAVAARIVIIAIFFLISAPTGSHIVARFTWNAGVYPWKPPKVRTGSVQRRKKSRSSSESRDSSESRGGAG